MCTRMGSRQTGSFWEQTIAASLYRVEMLGLYALHLLVRVISEFFHNKDWLTVLCCDNETALAMSSYHLGLFRPSAKCADI